MTNPNPDGAIMAPREMAGSTTHTEQDELAAAGLYTPPLHHRPARHPSAWATILESRERRLWTIALAGMLVVSATAIGLVYADDANKQATIHSLQTANESVTGRNLILQDQLQKTQANLTATLAELANTKAQLDHPTLGTWSAPVTIASRRTLFSSPIPDAFTLHLQLKATAPVNVSILTIDEYVAARECIANGVGDTDYCMVHQDSEVSFLERTTINYDFHKAEGCADYIVVLTADNPVTVTPNVSVTYNPASAPTGSCA